MTSTRRLKPLTLPVEITRRWLSTWPLAVAVTAPETRDRVGRAVPQHLGLRSAPAVRSDRGERQRAGRVAEHALERRWAAAGSPGTWRPGRPLRLPEWRASRSCPATSGAAPSRLPWPPPWRGRRPAAARPARPGVPLRARRSTGTGRLTGVRREFCVSSPDRPSAPLPLCCCRERFPDRTDSEVLFRLRRPWRCSLHGYSPAGRSGLRMDAVARRPYWSSDARGVAWRPVSSAAGIGREAGRGGGALRPSPSSRAGRWSQRSAT